MVTTRSQAERRPRRSASVVRVEDMQDSQIPPHMEPISATSLSARASTPSRAGVTSRARPQQQALAPSQHSRDTGDELGRLEQRIRELEGTRWSRDSTPDPDWEPSATSNPREDARVRPAELVSYRGPLSEEIMLYRVPPGYRPQRTWKNTMVQRTPRPTSISLPVSWISMGRWTHSCAGLST